MDRVVKARKEKIHLHDVVQTMLRRRILLLQQRTKPMWEYTPTDTMTVSSFIHPTAEKMWKSLFKTEEESPGHVKPFPKEGIDRGLTEEAGGDQV